MPPAQGLPGDWDGLVVLHAANSYDSVKFADQHMAESLSKLVPVLYVDPPVSFLTPLRRRPQRRRVRPRPGAGPLPEGARVRVGRPAGVVPAPAAPPGAARLAETAPAAAARARAGQAHPDGAAADGAAGHGQGHHRA